MKYLQNGCLKLVVAALIVVWTVYQFIQDNIGNSIALILLLPFSALLYFHNESIPLALLRLRKQDFEGMEKWLNKIADPETVLLRKQQGYYSYIYGVTYTRKSSTQAGKYFRKALQLSLTMDYDKAMIKTSLADIMIQERKKREAQELLTEAKKLDK